MAITSNTNRISYSANGVQTAFTFPYIYYNQTQLLVYVDSVLQTLGSTYTVAPTTAQPEDGNNGGTVTFLLAPANGTTVQIIRSLLIEQTIVLNDGSNFPAKTIEKNFDQLVMMLQQQQETISRALVIPITESANMQLPALAARKNSYLAFDSNGLPIVAASPSISGTTVLASGSTTARTLAERFHDWINVKDFGAVGDGVTDDTAAIQAAINSITPSVGNAVFFPTPTVAYKITAQLSIPNSGTFGTGLGGVRLTGTGKACVIKKFFNGDMLSLGDDGQVDNLFFDGNGGTYTGKGIVVPVGQFANGTGKQKILHNWIWNTQSYAIDIASNAGYMGRIEDNFLDTYNYATYAIHWGYDNTGPTNWKVIGNNSLGPFADFNGVSDCTVMANIAGQGPIGGPYTIPSITMSSLNKPFKMRIIGNSWKDGNLGVLPAHTYFLDSGSVVGNQENGGYKIGTTTIFSQFAHALTSSGVAVIAVDESNGSNEVWEVLKGYTPTWTGSGSNPAIGNGSIVGWFERKGRTCTVKIDIIMGSTTTFGTGTYTFSLPPNTPAPSLGDSVGSALIIDASALTYSSTAFVTTGGITVYVGATAGLLTHNNPVAWANGDRFIITVTYMI